MSSETWIVFKADAMDAPGWETRLLMPSDSLTDILSEEWDAAPQPRIPKVGDRVREYTNLAEPGDGVSHGREGDWVITRVHHFSSFDTDQKIVVCYCNYQPIPVEWQELRRGAPVSDMMNVALS